MTGSSVLVQFRITMITEAERHHQIIADLIQQHTSRSGFGNLIPGRSNPSDRRWLGHIPEQFRGEEGFMLAAVKQNGKALEYATQELRRDREIVIAAVNQHGWALEDADDELKRDREIVLAAINQDGYALKFAASELRRDREIVLTAVNQRGDAVGCAADELKRDKEIVLAAVKQNGKALEYATQELRRDREIVLAAVNQRGGALSYAADELKRDRQIVLAAVNQDGMALRFAADHLRSDREIVLAAVNQNGHALEYAPDELKRDKDIVLAAVHQTSSALSYADDEMHEDEDIAMILNEKKRLIRELKETPAEDDCMFTAGGDIPEDCVHSIALAATNLTRSALESSSPEETQEDIRRLQKASDFILKAGHIQEYAHVLKNEEEGRRLIREWARQKKMKDRIKALVQFDRSLAGVSRLFRDSLHPDCAEAIELALANS